MLKKTGFGFALGISAFLLAGCGGNGEPKEKPNGIGANVDKKDAAPPEKKVVRASPQTITLYVPEMQKRGGYEGAELT